MHIPTCESQKLDILSFDEALAMLKPPQPEIVNMKLMGQLSFKEIAETLKLPMGTVTWHYREAVKKLRRYVCA